MSARMIRRLLAGAALTVATATQAALPFGSLEFIQRVAGVAPEAQIDVWVRLTLDPGSDALDFSSNPLAGFNPADLPTEGQYYNPDSGQYETRAYAEITGAYLNTWFGCDDTFTGGCNGNTANYSYSFFLSSEPGKPSLNFRDTFSLAPGASFDYVFAQFNPAAGGAAPGSYLFYSTGATLNFVGVDAEGHSLTSGHTIAQTCPLGSNADCAFTRIVAVPEPSSVAMMVLGLAALIGLARRRRD